jgi:hypothetical protein
MALEDPTALPHDSVILRVRQHLNAHPTERQLHTHVPVELDLESVFHAAQEYDVSTGRRKGADEYQAREAAHRDLGLPV